MPYAYELRGMYSLYKYEESPAQKLKELFEKTKLVQKNIKPWLKLIESSKSLRIKSLGVKKYT